MKILIDNGHGVNTKGKCSPDGLFREYAWAREFAAMLVAALLEKGYDASLLVPELEDIPLKERVRRVNYWCSLYGKKNVLLVSIHNNAAGGDGKWHIARGFSVFVSKNASASSKELATYMFDLALMRDMLGNRSKPKADADNKYYWTWSWTEADIYILKNSNCPAVLTENMFQDNKDDVEYLQSEEGKNALLDMHVDAIVKYINSK